MRNTAGKGTPELLAECVEGLQEEARPHPHGEAPPMRSTPKDGDGMVDWSSPSMGEAS
jgi:hypothetical protein